MRSLLALAAICSSVFAAPVPKEVKTGDLFEGTWKLEKTVINGRKMDDPERDVFWKIDEKHSFTVHVANEETPAIRVVNPQLPGGPWALKSIGPKTTQLRFDTIGKEIDFSNGGLIRQGMYDLKGDTLTICLNLPGSPRPTSVKATENTQVWTLKRSAK